MDKDLEQVSGGFQFDTKIHIDPKPKPSPFSPDEIKCWMRDVGTEACPVKGQLTQCSDCRKNHD